MFYSIGYVEPDTSLMLAAGLGIAKAISSKRVDKRFAGEVMDDETVGSTIINYRREGRARKEEETYQTENQQKTYDFYFN